MRGQYLLIKRLFTQLNFRELVCERITRKFTGFLSVVAANVTLCVLGWGVRCFFQMVGLDCTHGCFLFGIFLLTALNVAANTGPLPTPNWFVTGSVLFPAPALVFRGSLAPVRQTFIFALFLTAFLFVSASSYQDIKGSEASVRCPTRKNTWRIKGVVAVFLANMSPQPLKLKNNNFPST